MGQARATALRLRSQGIDARYVLTNGVTNMTRGYYVVYSAEPSYPSTARVRDLRAESGVPTAYAKCGGVTEC